MKVLHLASEFPPAKIFGLGRYVHDLARAQVRQGHDVHVISNSLSGREHDAKVHGICLHRIHFPGPPKPPDGATQVTQFNHLLYERAVELAAHLNGTDVVVAHDWLTLLSAQMLQRLLKGRFILTIHDTVIGKTFGKLSNEDKYIAQIERWGCRVADATIAVSPHVANELTGVYEAPPERVHVVSCAVDEAWFGGIDEQYLPDLKSAIADPDDFVIAYVGRLDPEKGVDVLVQALARLLPKHPSLRLVLAGKGSEEPRLRDLGKELKVAQRMRFLGYVAGPALAAFYRVCNLLVCPSTYEPFGIVPLEGMINNLPVIASDTGGMAQIVEHEKSGLKVKPGDIADLSAAIGRIISDPELGRSLAQAGKERARTVYSWGRVAEQVEPIYSGRIQRRAAPTILSPRTRPRLTAAIRVKNGERFAQECLSDLSEYVDRIVILDDGSTDQTPRICKGFEKVAHYVRWEKDFYHEGIDRNVVLALAKDTEPEWILLPDIDEVFEERFKAELPSLLDRQDVALYAFLFCHFWRSRTHYRVDGKWGRESREFPIPRLVRNQPGLFFPVDKPLGSAQIRGVRGRAVVPEIRVKHYGHLHEDLSRQKVELYSKMDPGQDYSYMVDERGLQLEEWVEEALLLERSPA